METVIETWQAAEAWAAIRACGKAGKSLDRLHGMPMFDEMVGVFTEAMTTIRENQQRRRAEEEGAAPQ